MTRYPHGTGKQGENHRSNDTLQDIKQILGKERDQKDHEV